MAEGSKRSSVLVTGSSGLIGSRVVDVLRAEHQVICLDVKRPAQTLENTQFIACDLADAGDTARAMDEVAAATGGALASVIHLAAYYDFTGAPSPLYRDLTVGGTEHLLRRLQALKVEQFVFSSSVLAMRAAPDGELLTEEAPLDPSWDYPRSKVEAEEVIAQERGKIPTVILRIAGVYTDDCQSIPIAQQIARIHQRELESYLFPGNASHGQTFVHLDDVVDCIRTVVAMRGQLGHKEVFLVGEPDTMSYSELQERIGELLHGVEWPTVRIPKAIAKAGAWVQDLVSGGEAFIKPWMIDLADANYPVDVRHARERLGWEAKHRLRDTLATMIERLQRDPVAWYKKNKLPVPHAMPRTRPPVHA